jgi:hypothetical protein
MASIVGCSVTTQCPQGSVGSQFNVEVKPGSQKHVCESLLPDEKFVIDVPGPLASLNIQSDFPVQVRVIEDRDGEEPSVEVAVLLGSRLDGRPLFYLDGFSGVADMDRVTSIEVVNVATSYSEEGLARGKKVVFRALMAEKP